MICRGVITVAVGFLCLLQLSHSFPDGAPIDSCVRPRPNQPYHSQVRPQPGNSNPFQVVASGNQYQPGQQIAVRIQGSSAFKGFLIQARDIASDQWIGEWIETNNTRRHPECSAITHADPQDKAQAALLWKAPSNVPPGQVYFTGTVLKDYSTFWSNIIAEVNPHSQ